MFFIGIDVIKVVSFVWIDEVNIKYGNLKKLYEGKKVIVGCDCLDIVCGVV